MRSTLLRMVTILLTPLLLTVGLSACDPAEQGRITEYKKGTYLGAPDSRLTEQQTHQLRQRARSQAGS